MKKIAFIIIIVCSALTAQAQLLYSISGKGNGQKSYILGTYHFAPPSFCDSIPGLWKALDEVKQVCGELVMADMANTENLTKFQSAMMLPEGVTLQSLMTEEEMGRLNTLCKEIMGTDFTNPLIGPNDDELGPRFPNMSEVYSHRLVKLAQQTGKKLNIHLQEGVYIGVSGPCFETPSEYKMFYLFGADAVGMSTVPEAIMARHRGIEVFALSVITDLGIIGRVEKASHEEVLEAAAAAGPQVVDLIYHMIPEI